MDLKKEIKGLSDEIAAQFKNIKKIRALADDIRDNNINVIKFDIMYDYITQMYDELRCNSEQIDKLCEELRKVEV